MAKIWLVADNFQGTDNDGEGYSIDSAWTDEMTARAVANSRYAHSVMSIEINDDGVPEYARDAYEKLKVWKQKNPKKELWEYSKYR